MITDIKVGSQYVSPPGFHGGKTRDGRLNMVRTLWTVVSVSGDRYVTVESRNAWGAYTKRDVTLHEFKQNWDEHS